MHAQLDLSVNSSAATTLMRHSITCSAILLLLASTGYSQTKPAALATNHNSPATVTAIVRKRTNAMQWFAATRTSEVYGQQGSLLRLSIARRIRHFDYVSDMGQSTELALPSNAVSAVAAQGQLGSGLSYFAPNKGNTAPVAATFRQGFLRYLHGRRLRWP